MRSFALALPLLLIPLLLIPSPVRADEGELVIAVEPGWALLGTLDGEKHHGAGGSFAAWFGIGEAAWLFAGAGAHRFKGAGLDVIEPVVGMVAALDVLRTIPFLEAAAGITFKDERVEPVLRVGIGADYLVTSTFSVGVVGRYRPLFGTGGESLLSASLRFALRVDL